MSDNTTVINEVTPEAAVETVCDTLAVEEQRAKLSLKMFLVKATSVTILFAFLVSLGTLLYAAVIQDKDLDTGFIGGVLKSAFEFLHFLLA